MRNVSAIGKRTRWRGGGVEEECARELQHLFTISINHLLRGLSGRALKYSLPSAPGRWEEGEVARELFPSTARPPSCGCNRNGSLMIAARRLKPHERHLIRRARLCLDRGNSSLAFSVREAKEKQLKEQKKQFRGYKCSAAST